MDKIKILDNFIDPYDCDFAIGFYNDLRDRKKFMDLEDGRWLLVNPKLDEVKYLVNKYVAKISQIYETTFYPREIFVSFYRTSSELEPHIDFEHPKLKDSLGMMLYFNEDFEGGEVYFPELDYQYKPVKGTAFIFPCNEYLHGVKAITKGYRYAMPIEITPHKEFSIYK